MQKKWTILAANLIAALLLTSPLTASTTIEPVGALAQDGQGFARDEAEEIAERQLSDLAQNHPELLTEEQRELIENEEKSAASDELDADEVIKATLWRGSYPNSIQFCKHFRTDQEGNYVLITQDKVQWTIQPSDLAMVKNNWSSRDPLIVVQNDNYRTKEEYPFCMINGLRDEKILVCPSGAPAKLTPKGHTISRVDRSNGIVRLQNGASFQVSYVDRHLLKQWAEDQFISIGQNFSDSWFFETYPNILINMRTSDFVRVRFLGHKK